MPDIFDCPYCSRRIVPFLDTIPKEPVNVRCPDCEKVFEFIHGFGTFTLLLDEQDTEVTNDSLKKYQGILPNRKELISHGPIFLVSILFVFIFVSILVEMLLVILQVIIENMLVLVFENILIVTMLAGMGLTIFGLHSAATFVKNALASTKTEHS